MKIAKTYIDNNEIVYLCSANGYYSLRHDKQHALKFENSAKARQTCQDYNEKMEIINSNYEKVNFIIETIGE